MVDYPPLPDNTPPTVAITDNVAGVTATGDVTFTFTFSEDVGTSFTTDDIDATGGTKGAFTRIDGKKATLVVAPAANSVGTIDITVAAGTFSDLAGNANTAAATATLAYDTNPIIKTQMDLPVTFDSATVAYGLIGFGGAEDSSVDPLIPPTPPTRWPRWFEQPAAETYAGTTITAAAGLGFASRIPFTATTRACRFGSGHRMPASRSASRSRTTPTTPNRLRPRPPPRWPGAWETLTFNFANQADGTAALNLAYDLRQGQHLLRLRPSTGAAPS